MPSKATAVFDQYSHLGTLGQSIMTAEALLSGFRPLFGQFMSLCACGFDIGWFLTKITHGLAGCLFSNSLLYQSYHSRTQSILHMLLLCYPHDCHQTGNDGTSHASRQRRPLICPLLHDIYIKIFDFAPLMDAVMISEDKIVCIPDHLSGRSSQVNQEVSPPLSSTPRWSSLTLSFLPLFLTSINPIYTPPVAPKTTLLFH